MAKKKLVILGSTGSIGRSALDVVQKNPDRIEILGLSTHTNIDLLREQADRFRPKYITVTDKDASGRLLTAGVPDKVEVLPSEDGLEQLAGLREADIVLNAVVGAVGLKASLAAVSRARRLALANKESMVIGGPLINEAASKSGAEIIPVDSEHSAIKQALSAGKKKEIRKLILTASGGPFREMSTADLEYVTVESALKHPTWNMGPKITIDSATMMNKGLEVIEAMHLFDIPIDRIEILIHPQSIIHSLVEFVDSSVISQMSRPDMRLPIAYALFYPDRVPGSNGHMELADIGRLTFMKPDFEKFPLLKSAYEVAAAGGTAPAVFNAAGEVAVYAFLKKVVKFKEIPDIVIETVKEHEVVNNPSLEDIIAADEWAGKTATAKVR